MTQPLDWSTKGVVNRRNTYYAATQRKFQPFEKPLILKRGRGQYLWDEEDNRLTDLLGMNLCISVGHAHPAVNAAAREQADQLPHCTTMFYHPVPAHFAEELAATMPAGEDWVVHFTNSGSEAIDLAMMMARSYTGNADLIALQGSYHGPTYGAQSVTGIDNFRHDVVLPGNVQFAPAPNAYRGAFGGDTAAYLDALDQTIKSGTTGKLAGMLIEPVQGYGGIIPMPDGYMQGAFERVRARGGLAIVDEVQSGFGRIGGNTLWAFDAHGVVPDIAVMAKGIGNGYPLGAVVTKRAIAEAMADKFLFHTYGANPMSCAAGRAVLQVIKDEGLTENCRTVGAALLVGLQDLQQRHSVIGDVRGCGLMMAIELVEDRTSKKPATDATVAVFEETRRQGLVVSKSGPDRNILRMVPPMCLSMEDVQPIISSMDAALAVLNK